MKKQINQITSVDGVVIQVCLDMDIVSVNLPFTHVNPQSALRIAAILAEDPTGVKSDVNLEPCEGSTK